MLNTKFMEKALQTAEKSGIDIPVGAVIVKDGEILSAFHNQKEALNDVTAHAEILALREASHKLSNWRLNGCDMYVTLEPCPMCAWAVMNSRIDNLYFGSYDKVYGGFTVLPNLLTLSNSKLNYKGGIMENECDAILNEYFGRIR